MNITPYKVGMFALCLSLRGSDCSFDEGDCSGSSNPYPYSESTPPDSTGSSTFQLFAESHDGGVSWDPLDTVSVGAKKIYCGATAGLAANVFCMGGQDADDKAAIWVSTNFGDEPWTKAITSSATGSTMYRMGSVPGNASRIIAVTHTGDFFNSVNSGYTWGPGQSTGVYVNGMDFFPNSTIGIAVGQTGRILRTLNGGVLWQEVSSGTTQDLIDVSCFTQGVGSDTAIVVGSGGMILRSTDSAQTWTQQTISGNPVLAAVAFSQQPNGRYGLILGSSTKLRSTDGGVTWVNETFVVINVRDLVVSATGNCIYTSNLGVRFSTDMGASWNTTGISKGMYELNTRVDRYDGIGYIFTIGN